MQDLIVTVNEREFKARFDDANHSTIYIDDKPFNIELLKKNADGVFSFVMDQRLLQVDLELDETGKLIITYDGLSHEVEVASETQKLLAKFVKTSGASAGEGTVKAPMPGLVVKALAEVGEVVEKGKKVIVIEAMKMENALAAPISGKIEKIYVSPGQAVDKNAPLLEIVSE